MKSILFISIFVIYVNIGFSQCDTKKVLTIVENMENLNEKQVNEFLNQFHEDCIDNVEFGEFSNETLFELTGKNPELLIKLLEQRKDKGNYKLIMKEFNSPIHDGFDFQAIYDTVNDIENDSETKNIILEKLISAGKSIGVEIEE